MIVEISLKPRIDYRAAANEALSSSRENLLLLLGRAYREDLDSALVTSRSVVFDLHGRVLGSGADRTYFIVEERAAGLSGRHYLSEKETQRNLKPAQHVRRPICPA